MKKALVLTSLASLAAISFGCVLTDYPSITVQNKSHGLIGCHTNDRIANSQQTIEGDTRELLYTTTFNGGVGPNCATGFDPGVDPNGNVSSQDARDWNRFNANWVFFGEAQVFGANGGDTYLLAGLKDLADGSRRINSMHRPGVGAFSCVGDNVDGRYGGPEGVVYGDAFGRLPGLHIEAVSIDSRAGNQFCPNIAAVSDDGAANGFSTYWGQNQRAYEGVLAATPITRREGGLANLLNQGTESVTIDGVTITGRGQLNADGSWTLDLLSLSNGIASYQAESPLKLTASPANHFKTWKVENTSQSEMVALAQFAIDSQLAGQTLSLAGKTIPEFGYTFPAVEFMMNPTALQAFIDASSAPTDGLGN